MTKLNQNAEQFLTDETKSIVMKSSDWRVLATVNDEANLYSSVIINTEASCERRKGLIAAYNESMQSYVRNLGSN